MSRTIKLFSAIFLLVIIENASSQNTFQKTYGGNINFFSGKPGLSTSDGGYILLGGSSSALSACSLIKTDVHGDTLWTRSYKIGRGTEGNSVVPTFDDGYLITGKYNDQWNVDHLCLIKTNYEGNLVWMKALSYDDFSVGVFVEQTLDHGYVILESRPDLNSRYFICLIKIDNDGNVLWSKNYSNGWDVGGSAVHQTNDGGFIISGNYYPNEFNYGGYLIKTNSYGDTLWTRVYGGTNNGFSSVQQTSDGGYITVGSIFTSGSDSGDVFLVKTKSNGYPLWLKTYGGTGREQGKCVQQTLDGGYIIVGETTSINPGSRDIYIIKTDVNGDTLWTKTYGGTGMNDGNSILQTSDGGYIIAGSMSGGNAGVGGPCFIKTDSLGSSGCNESSSITITGIPVTPIWVSLTYVGAGFNPFDAPTAIVSNGGIVNTICSHIGINEITRQENIISVFPNPAKNDFTIKINNSKKNSEIVIYNMFGKEVMSSKFSGNRVEITNANLENGIYLLKLLNEDKYYVEKLIIQKDQQDVYKK